MFTGIISHVTKVTDSRPDGDGLTLTFQRPTDWDDLALGESVSTDGVCLTVAALDDATYACHLMAETLAKSTFGRTVPERVNLERALRAGDRLGGHFVQGHVDDVGTITGIDRQDGLRLTVKFAPGYGKFVVEKGSITINGVSLTVTDVTQDTLSVALIPHTAEHTTLGSLKEHDRVNLEFDMIAKHIVKVSEVYAKS